ncbi:MAG TPA: ribosome maturation factor RimM [Pseudacidobacterium sp.]|nr:ribosome maturation factor RimM [Pseudacidobacterium sp.]
MNNVPQWIVIAHLVRPQGRRGEVLADILTDFPERFSDRRELMLLDAGGRPLRAVSLEAHWLHKGRVVLKFAGCDSISDAEALRGLDVAISREQRVPLDADSVYISDLIGCCVVLPDGAEAGKIVAVDRETTDAPLLVLETGRSDQVLVPFAKSYLRQINLETRQIVMDLPEGLLDVNSSSSAEEN